MKRHIESAIVLICAVSLASCSKTEEFNSNPDGALEIASVSGISSYKLMSKAVITDDTLPEDEYAKGIGLFVKAADGGAYDGKTEGFSNVRYTYNGEKWSTTTPVYLSKTEGKLYGYFPYSETATKLEAIPVASSLNGTDYLYATPNDVSYTDKSVSLQMNHALARFHLTIKKGDKYLKDCELSKITIESKAIDSYGTMNITTGTVSGLKDEGTIGSVVFDGDGVTGTVTKEGIEKDILLVPADNKNGKKELSLTLTIDGSDAKIKFSEEGGLDIRSGIQCNATIEIQDSGIKVTGVEVGVWGDGGSQTVQVNGHTVTVKLDEVVVPNDILTDIHIEGQSVIIKATSIQKSSLSCNVGDDAQCQRVKDNDIYTFTISDISSNVEAVLSYSIVTITVKSDDSNGKVWIGDDESKTSGKFYSGQKVVIHAAPNDKFRLYRWNDNNRETRRTFTVVGEDDAEYSASFISSDLIPGLFTVNSDGKQVFFSKGNLWYGKLNGEDAATFHLESNQYESTPSTDKDRDETHISHFMWCDDAANARALSYNTEWNGINKSFFAGKDFTVNGYSGWGVLTGGDNGEWAYLLNTRKTIYGKDTDVENRRYAAVKVNGMAGLLIFPDDFSSWPSGAGNEPQTFNTNSSNWNDRNYAVEQFTVLQNNGCVFLPAAGYRNGNKGLARVFNVGNFGYYWSASPNSDILAFDLNFHSGLVNPSNDGLRNQTYSVRLVTEYQSEPSAK